MADFNVELEKFIDQGLNEKLSEALLKACLIVEAEAKKKCPGGDGQLRQSITHDVDSTALIGEVGTNVVYAPYVEIGTGIYSTQGNGRKTPWTYYSDKLGQFFTTIGQQAQPFLEPALNDNASKIEECFKGII